MRKNSWDKIGFSVLAVSAGVIATSASAAEISHTRVGDLDVISIIGDIEVGDDRKFRRLSLAFERAVIALDSNGGTLLPAIEIGKIIKISKHATAVVDGSTCASACALIWVAGSTKYLSSGGRVGFHAAYKDEAGRKLETGIGNALVGHYLGSLSLPEKAVMFATAASPNEILWLDASTKSLAGIEFEPFPGSTRSSKLQVTATTASSVPILAPSTTNAFLRVGTEVPLRLLEELTTGGKKLRVGQRFRMETSAPVIVQGVVVIPTGSPAVGEITDVRNKGMWGKSGKLNARVLYVIVNGRQIRMTGGFDDKGVAGGIGAVAVSAIIFAPAGFFMTGTSAKVPVGSAVKGFVDEDVPLNIASSAPPPLTVAAPSAPMLVAPASAQTNPPRN